MADLAPRANWARCERCGGQMHRDAEGGHTCMWCGEERFPAATRGPSADAKAYGVRLDRPRARRPQSA
jgi:hypothetical protein